jgi:hypothetical protein
MRWLGHASSFAMSTAAMWVGGYNPGSEPDSYIAIAEDRVEIIRRGDDHHQINVTVSRDDAEARRVTISPRTAEVRST